MKLISMTSMTDFVLVKSLGENYLIDKKGRLYSKPRMGTKGGFLKEQNDRDYRFFRDNYDNFLEQPLKLEMFVPCDEEGNVLEEPKIEEEYVDEHTTQIFAQYQYDLDKAKEKVLFEDFELISETDETWLFKINGNFPRIVGKKLTIESLRIFKDKIKLSQSALNAIFGKTIA